MLEGLRMHTSNWNKLLWGGVAAVVAVGLLALLWSMGNVQPKALVIHRFAQLEGPKEPTVVAAPHAAAWTDFQSGQDNRLAILLTDPQSRWLGLAHGLKTAGVPFLITRDVTEALKHRVVLVYPTISGKVLSAPALQALARFPEQGGTLIGFHVEGGGLQGVFGFSEAKASRARSRVKFDAQHPLAASLTDPKEQTIPFSNPAAGDDAVGSLGYVATSGVLARFDDGLAAITARDIGPGHAYALGVDLGYLLQLGYSNREDGIARSYVNQFEPALDVWLRVLTEMYRQGEPRAVTLSTVPGGKSLSTLITHDIDFGPSMANSPLYAKAEQELGIKGTYFIQTKYVRDWNDDIFFNDSALAPLRKTRDMGMEIGSHSVAHSPVFNKAETGDGRETYPHYQPFVYDKARTDGLSVSGELRISKFLLENFLPQYQVTSFRPGHLKDPYALPQWLEATGFRYSSSATANNSLTHWPFRLTHGRQGDAPTSIYEFPVTIEDEASPKLGDRVPQAVALADQLARYGGLMVVLIHTDITGHKLAFEQQFVSAVKARSWFGTVQEFGQFWVARDQVDVDVARDGAGWTLLVQAPKEVSGLTLRLPAGCQVQVDDRDKDAVASTEGLVVFKRLSGQHKMPLRHCRRLS